MFHSALQFVSTAKAILNKFPKSGIRSLGLHVWLLLTKKKKKEKILNKIHICVGHSNLRNNLHCSVGIDPPLAWLHFNSSKQFECQYLSEEKRKSWSSLNWQTSCCWSYSCWSCCCWEFTFAVTTMFLLLLLLSSMFGYKFILVYSFQKQ